jgi:hypothetical protein
VISETAVVEGAKAINGVDYSVFPDPSFRISRTVLEAAESHTFAAKAVTGVLEIHRERQNTDEDGEPAPGTHCEECKDVDDGELVYEIYPCRTVREVQAALLGQETYTDMRNAIEEMVK